MQIYNRNELPEILKSLGLNGYGVEIGVQRGVYSHKILSGSELKVLYSVDPWITFPDEEYEDWSNTTQESHNDLYVETVERLKEFTTRSVCMRLTSEDAVKHFSDGFFDFIYIDANHSYEECKKDIGLWWPKTKKGGMIAGHDYVGDVNVSEGVDEDCGGAAHWIHEDGRTHESPPSWTPFARGITASKEPIPLWKSGSCGVVPAVNEFIKDNGLELWTTPPDQVDCDYDGGTWPPTWYTLNI